MPSAHASRTRSPSLPGGFLSTGFLVLLALLGMFISIKQLWVASLVIAGVSMLVSSARRSTLLGLRLQWLVQFEPPATDILLMVGFFRRALLSATLRIPKPDNPLTPLALFVVLNLAQLAVVHDLGRGVLFASVSAYVLVVLVYIFWNISSHAGCSWDRALAFSVYVTATIIIVLGLSKAMGAQSFFAHLFDGTRPRAFFKDPNVAAPFIAFWVLRVLSYYLRGNRLALRSWASIGFLIVALMFTFSRGVFVNLFAGTVVLAIVLVASHKPHKLIVFLLLGVVATIIALPASSYLGQERFLRINEYDLEGRLAAWKSGWMIVQENPFGVGPGQFEYYSVQYQQANIGNRYITPSAHNLYLRVLAENGVLGFLLLAWAVLMTIWKLVVAIRAELRSSSRAYLPELTWVLAAMVGMLTEGLVIDVLHWRHFGIALGLALFFVDAAGRSHATTLSGLARKP